MSHDLRNAGESDTEFVASNMGKGDHKKNGKKNGKRNGKNHHKKNDRKPSPTLELKNEIERELESSHYPRSFRETRFVSLGFIARLFESENPPKLLRSIQTDCATLKKENLEQHTEGVKIEDLVTYVKKDASKLYAVLLLIGHSPRIFQLFKDDHPVTDRIFEQGGDSSDVPYCSFEYLESMALLKDIAKEIFEKQWCIPPILHQEIDQIFPPKLFRFPFPELPQQIGQGGYGAVYKVKIADGHLEVADQSYVRVRTQSFHFLI